MVFKVRYGKRFPCSVSCNDDASVGQLFLISSRNFSDKKRGRWKYYRCCECGVFSGGRVICAIAKRWIIQTRISCYLKYRLNEQCPPLTCIDTSRKAKKRIFMKIRFLFLGEETKEIVNHSTENLYSSPTGRGDIRNGRSHCETTRVSRISPGNRHDIQSGNYKTAVENHRHREHMSSRCHPWSTFFDVDTGANACTHARTNGRARIPTPPCTHRLCAHSFISARIHVCVRRKFWIIWHVVVHVIIQIDVEIRRVERTSDFLAANPVLRYSLFLQSLALKAKLNTINFAYIIICFLWCTAY